MLSWLDPYLAWGLHVKLRFPGNSSKLIQSQFILIISAITFDTSVPLKEMWIGHRGHTAHGARNVLNKLCTHMPYKERNSSLRTGSMCAWYVFSYGHISKGHLTALSWLSHFRVPETLTFKTRLNAKPFLAKMSFICLRIDLIHDTRHLFTRSTDGMKEKSGGFSRT